MTPARRPFPSVLALLAATAGAVSLVACGGSAATGIATGPAQSAGPDTTPLPTATAQATPTPTVQPTPSPTPTATATAQATRASLPCPVPATDTDGACKVGQTLYPSDTFPPCAAHSHYDTCPITSRLAARLDSHPTDGAEPLCRCQNYWQKSTVSVTQTPDPTVWVVHVVLDFGLSPAVKIDVRILHSAGGWVGDDTTCTGHGTDTSIYVQNPPPCPG
jgi:hypothetical protein